jgi:hypothetical protein
LAFCISRNTRASHGRLDEVTATAQRYDVAATQLVEQQKAIVFFKGERIYTLCYLVESNVKDGETTVSEILNNGYSTKAFFYKRDNCLFFEYTHLGW